MYAVFGSEWNEEIGIYIDRLFYIVSSQAEAEFLCRFCERCERWGETFWHEYAPLKSTEYLAGIGYAEGSK